MLYLANGSIGQDREGSVKQNCVWGECGECTVISALTLLRTGSIFRNRVLLLPVGLGKRGPRRGPVFNGREKVAREREA